MKLYIRIIAFIIILLLKLNKIEMISALGRMIIANIKENEMPKSKEVSLYPKKYIIAMGRTNAKRDCTAVSRIILSGNSFAW